VSDVFEVDPASPERAGTALDAATAALSEGRLVVLPTETVYGVACRPDDRAATGRLFEAKRRPARLNLPVLAATTEEAWVVGGPTAVARRLAAAYWPGPLTMVLARADRSRDWDLGAERNTVGVRVPDHPLTGALLARAGPLATTSANRSGSPPLERASTLVDAFGEAVAVYLVLPEGARQPAGVSSTVVDLTGDRLRLRRRGPIPLDALLSVGAGRPPGPDAGGSR
jgi:tRNA threonylcarbamoyl adenosine modification protein (Sua5/YciO/YrdC/YwlC family)